MHLEPIFLKTSLGPLVAHSVRQAISVHFAVAQCEDTAKSNFPCRQGR